MNTKLNKSVRNGTLDLLSSIIPTRFNGELIFVGGRYHTLPAGMRQDINERIKTEFSPLINRFFNGLGYHGDAIRTLLCDSLVKQHSEQFPELIQLRPSMILDTDAVEFRDEITPGTFAHQLPSNQTWRWHRSLQIVTPQRAFRLFGRFFGAGVHPMMTPDATMAWGAPQEPSIFPITVDPGNVHGSLGVPRSETTDWLTALLRMNRLSTQLIRAFVFENNGVSLMEEFNKVKSIGGLLKHQPELIQFLPSEFMEKHNVSMRKENPSDPKRWKIEDITLPGDFREDVQSLHHILLHGTPPQTQ